MGEADVFISTRGFLPQAWVAAASLQSADRVAGRNWTHSNLIMVMKQILFSERTAEKHTTSKNFVKYMNE